tara:strand:+ start:116 stop:256 length:141 start_codon:yes stop_codon:yes gene_type:complete
MAPGFKLALRVPLRGLVEMAFNMNGLNAVSDVVWMNFLLVGIYVKV